MINEAEILQITDSINYDFDTGIDSLSNVNIIFDGDYKVNMDFADGGFVGYLEIDPTFGYTTYDDKGRNWSSSGSGACETRSFSGGSGTVTNIYAHPTGDCQSNHFNFNDLSSIPDESTIISANFKYSLRNSRNLRIYRSLTSDSQPLPSVRYPSAG